MGSISDFRKRKLRRFFTVIDADGDGVFTRADIEILGNRLCQLRGLEPGTPPHQTFMAGFMYYWDDLRKTMDVDEDGKVTPEEWTAYHESMLEDRKRFDATAAQSAGLMFGLVDRDSDGTITVDEYAEWMRAWSMIDDDDADEVLGRLDPDARGTFTRDDVLALTEAFFYADDPDAPGNWAMGRY